MKFINQILQGDAMRILRKLPSESVDCVMTSPPYWVLRDYQTPPQIWDVNKSCKHEWLTKIQKWHSNRGPNKRKEIFDDEFQVAGTKHLFCGKCGAWCGSLGLEPTFQLYVKHLCDIFDEARRVLKKTGTCWVNISDTYQSASVSGKQGGGLPDKCLLQIPARFGIEMINRGWILRNRIIWKKPNCMPTSAKDRFTVDYEDIYFFTKSKKYYFETQYENAKYDGRKQEIMRGSAKYAGEVTPGRAAHTFAKRAHERWQIIDGKRMRNRRCVWTINTKPYKGAHFATFPQELIKTPIVAGCPAEGIVMDIFAGSGTTLEVAKLLGRKFVGIELNPEYIKLAEQRINSILI